MYSKNDPSEDKVRRKRVLVSSDFKTAFRFKRIFNIYYELNQSRWTAENIKHKKFVTFFFNTMNDLQKRYDGPAFI